jgi:Flp pilus assembly protein TadD
MGGAPADSLETYIRKVRLLSVAAKPRSGVAPNVESLEPELRDALRALSAEPSGANMRRVGAAYLTLGILDAAYDHYAAAAGRDHHDAEAYDALARIWRDWGFAELGLGDAQRAAFYAPQSAAAQNTLGTLFHAVGNQAAARRAFEQALVLDANASYAWTNLCYISALAGDGARAVSECRRAVMLDAGSIQAHNDLGLAYAVSGDLVEASAEFGLAGGAAGRAFNMGVVLAAARRYAAAAEAFEVARSLRTDWPEAADRARQARAHVASEPAREN